MRQFRVRRLLILPYCLRCIDSLMDFSKVNENKKDPPQYLYYVIFMPRLRAPKGMYMVKKYTCTYIHTHIIYANVVL